MRRQCINGFRGLVVAMISCQASVIFAAQAPGLVSTEVLLTSAAGHKLAVMDPVVFYPDGAALDERHRGLLSVRHARNQL